jgi:hypothetical protein
MSRLALVVLVLVACGSKEASKSEKSEKSEKAEKAEKSDADIEATYKAARASVDSGHKWSASIAKVEQQLGPPKVKSDQEVRWAAVDGGSCYSLRHTRIDDIVNGVFHETVSSIVTDLFAKCKATAEAR